VPSSLVHLDNPSPPPQDQYIPYLTTLHHFPQLSLPVPMAGARTATVRSDCPTCASAADSPTCARAATVLPVQEQETDQQTALPVQEQQTVLPVQEQETVLPVQEQETVQQTVLPVQDQHCSQAVRAPGRAGPCRAVETDCYHSVSGVSRDEEGLLGESGGCSEESSRILVLMSMVF
jgi:hypothetical protein